MTLDDLRQNIVLENFLKESIVDLFGVGPYPQSDF